MRHEQRPMIGYAMRRCWPNWTIGSSSCWRNASGSISRRRGWGSSVAVDQEWVQAEGLKKKIQQAIEALEKSGQEKLNLTDPDCAVMHSVQGSHASYNVQSVVDDKHGLIVHAAAVSETSDINQFAEQI